jgi:hypothetical protein
MVILNIENTNQYIFRLIEKLLLISFNNDGINYVIIINCY